MPGDEARSAIRKEETWVKLFIALMSLLMIVVAVLTVGSYNGYHPNPASVSATGFILVVTVLLTAVWYKTKYPGYCNSGEED
jgi:protein-S-isoprenylcysteine O-methyltransferase Ste14